MVHGDAVIVDLIRQLSAERRQSESYVSLLVSGSGDTIKRITCDGMSLTGRRAERITRELSRLWPEHLEWPLDVPRPEPSPAPASEAKEAA